MDKKELFDKYKTELEGLDSNFDTKIGFYKDKSRWDAEKTDYFRGYFSPDDKWWVKTENEIFSSSFNENYAVAFLIGSSLTIENNPEYANRINEIINKIIPESKYFKLMFNDYAQANFDDKYDIGIIVAKLSGFKKNLRGTILQW